MVVEELADVIEATPEGRYLSTRCDDPDHAGAVSLDISPEMIGLSYCLTCNRVSYDGGSDSEPPYHQAPISDTYR